MWKYLLSSILACMMVASMAQAQMMPESVPGVTTIDAKKAKQWLDSGEDIVFLDVNKAAIYNKGHIPGAEHCEIVKGRSLDKKLVTQTVSSLNKCDSLEYFEKDSKIIVYCMSPG